jgi:hypothetical protein
MIHGTWENDTNVWKNMYISGKSLNMVYSPKEDKGKEQEKRNQMHFFCTKN